MFGNQQVRITELRSTEGERTDSGSGRASSLRAVPLMGAALAGTMDGHQAGFRPDVQNPAADRPDTGAALARTGRGVFQDVPLLAREFVLLAGFPDVLLLRPQLLKAVIRECGMAPVLPGFHPLPEEEGWGSGSRAARETVPLLRARCTAVTLDPRAVVSAGGHGRR